MKKRILALILCVLMVLPVFAGCAKTEAEKSKMQTKKFRKRL